jgi:hypothetical protein
LIVATFRMAVTVALVARTQEHAIEYRI